MNIRELDWRDLGKVVDLELLLFPKDAWTAEMFWQELAGVPENRHYLVAVDGPDGSISGYAGLAFVGSEAEIQTIAVSPDSQGQGIGRQLLRQLDDHAQSMQVTQCFLEVRRSNRAAFELYRSEGFTELEVRKKYYRDGEDAIIMMKERNV